MNTAMRSLLAEPPVADPPARVWRDWLLVAAASAGAVLELAFRDEVSWPVASLVAFLGVAVTVLWRRTHPLAMLAIGFGTGVGLGVAGAIAGVSPPPGLDTMAIVLVLPYALVRWASGRHVAIGATIMFAAWVVGSTTDQATVGDAIGGFTVLVLPAAIGGVVRFRAAARDRELDEVKLREREQLARELHDTVAHHVSAIVIQAQAGRAIASTRPAVAAEVLAAIEGEATRTLDEMRAMVGALRRDGDAPLAPQQGIADIHRLAHVAPSTMTIDVRVDGDLSAIDPVIGAAAYRIAQESVTNAVRHARNATRVDIHLAADDDEIVLDVVDDGDHTHAATAAGYGLIGMTERAELLGGSLDAGRAPAGGWRVTAHLPRSVVASA